jgi:lipoprotein-anchoring transpeptidase ErfK/SrfK
MFLSINAIYIISAVLIVAAIIVLLYSRIPFGRHVTSVAGGNEDETADVLSEPNSEVETPRTVATLAAEPQPEPNLISLASKAVIQSDPKIAKLIAEAMALVNSQPSAVIEARDRLNDTLLICRTPPQRKFIKQQLSKLAERWLFSKSLFPNDKLCGSYKIKQGDQLKIIGKRHKVPYEILMQINNIHNPQALQVGQTIKIINGPFHAKVSRSTFMMDIYLQNTFVRSFPVGLGRPSKETPTGLWQVKKDGKMEQPIWTDPDTQRVYKPTDPDYPLGSRWIELEGMEGNAKDKTGFGIHGTKEPETIGVAESRGCIRLHNGHAILVYNLLVPIYSQVRVEE